jgi:phospholipase/carboxylesterase
MEHVAVALAPREGAAPHPALVLLHGRGADEGDLLGLAPALDPRLLVVSLRAPLDWPGGGYAWYRLTAPATPDLATFRSSLARLEADLARIPAHYRVDPTRLYLLGFSQGAVMASALLLTAPGLVAGAVCLSGFAPPLDATPARGAALAGKPTFLAHGTLDRVIAVDLGRSLRTTLEGSGVYVTYREYAIAHEIGDAELADLGTWLGARLGRGQE